MTDLVRDDPRTVEDGAVAARLDFLWLELTGKCNLACRHCYASSGPDQPLHGRMRHADWEATIRQAAGLGCRAIQFIGGEPLLYPRIDDLVSLAQAEGFQLIEIFTNGTPINRERAEFFRKFGVRIACSFYSADPAVHDRITQKRGSFDRTVTALRLLNDAQVSVRAGFIEMEENRGHFEPARALLAGLGVERVGHDAIRAFGRGETVAVEPPATTGKYGGLCGQCWRNRLCVNAGGDLSPCPMSREFVVGNVLDDGLETVLRAAPLRTFQTEMAAEFGVRAHPGGPGKPKPEDAPPCGPGPVPCMICGPGNCSPDFACLPDNACPICFPGLCIPG